MKRFYKAILPMAVILNLVVSIMPISSLFGRASSSSLQDLDGVIVINSISEPYTLISLGIGLIGLARISRKRSKIKDNNKVQRHYHDPNKFVNNEI
jgi:hypothetical protein